MSSGANLVHRYLWKFQAWLNGYNGGPIRQPAMKLSESQMGTVGRGVAQSGHRPGRRALRRVLLGPQPRLR